MQQEKKNKSPGTDLPQQKDVDTHVQSPCKYATTAQFELIFAS
jgi:hypothetical protein